MVSRIGTGWILLSQRIGYNVSEMKNRGIEMAGVLRGRTPAAISPVMLLILPNAPQGYELVMGAIWRLG